MKSNLPVTDIERDFPASEFLISETDAKGIIRVANPAFCRVSGFSESQLIGHNHNVVRHPDIPSQVFADLWRTIKTGAQWTGVVKNRCANGDFYWVHTSVTPIYKGSNKIAGYRSIRKKPSRDAIVKAQALYSRINRGEKIAFDTMAQRRKSAGLIGSLSLTKRSLLPVSTAVFGSLTAGILSLYQVDSQWVMATAGLSSLLSLALTVWISGRTKSTVLQVWRGVRDFDRGDISSRIDYYGDDELGMIARLFNRSADMVETSLADINQSTKALSEGDFMHRVELTMEGDFEAVKESVNATISTLDSIFAVFKQQITALAEGDFSGHVQVQAVGEYKAIFDYIMQALEARHDRLNEMIGYVDAASHGDFSGRLSELNVQGSNKTLVQQVNRLFELVEENLSDISRITNHLAQGDLTQRIDADYPGLFGETANGVNKMRQSLLDMVKAMASSIEVIHNASLQISNGNMDFAQRTEVQSVSLKKNAISMENLLTRVKQTADNARLANQLVMDTSSVAVQGGEAVGEVINTMVSINQSSHKVANIIGVIDEIAFQTNILALNAAVEAARAGEQGRGFAVVASEVRSLAQRSAAAAKEIKSLIQVSVANVETGNTRVEYAGKTINEVVSSVNRVTDLMADISLASSEQSIGIDQVKDVITQIDAITQMNNVLAGESIEAASILEKQSRYLREMIANFSSDSDSASQVDVVATGAEGSADKVLFELF
jgi:methyl-accepting chemotaxis protein